MKKEIKIPIEHVVNWTEEEFKIKYSEEWEKSVKITYWEHDLLDGFYIIKYEDKHKL